MYISYSVYIYIYTHFKTIGILEYSNYWNVDRNILTIGIVIGILIGVGSSMAISGTEIRGYPHKIWPYMVEYLHFRILKFPLNSICNHTFIFSIFSYYVSDYWRWEYSVFIIINCYTYMYVYIYIYSYILYTTTIIPGIKKIEYSYYNPQYTLGRIIPTYWSIELEYHLWLVYMICVIIHHRTWNIIYTHTYLYII